MPAAIKALAAYLGDGDATACRAALRVYELSYGRPAKTIELDSETLARAASPRCVRLVREGASLGKITERHRSV